MMKRYFFSTMLALALVLFLSLLPSRTARAANPREVHLTGSYYTGYDITGDGVSDTIRMTKYKSYPDVYDEFLIFINGKEALYLKAEYGFYDSTVTLYTLQNGSVIVYVYLAGDDGDGPCALYVYENEQLKQILDFAAFFKYGFHNTGKVLKVSENFLKVEFSSMSYAFAPISMKYTYEYNNGELKSVSKYGNVKIHKAYNQGHGKKVTARKSFWLYKNAVSSKKKWKVKKGQSFKVETCYINGSKVRFRIKLSNGKKGWLNSPKKSLRRPLIKETMYAG